MSRASAERKRRERAAKHAGKVHVAFWIDEADLAAKCDAAGTIDPNHADNPKALAEATRRLIEALQIHRVARDTSK